MNKCYTSMGIYVEPSVDPGYFTGPSMSREEQIKRLECLKKVKGMNSNRQMELGESVFITR